MNKRFSGKHISGRLAAVLAIALVFSNVDMTAFAADSQGTEKNLIMTVSEQQESEIELETESMTKSEEESAQETEQASETETSETEQTQTQETEEYEQETETTTAADEKLSESGDAIGEKELSKAVKDLQSRIDALPTVDEFIKMADGTTAEDSTLNQAQLDVYDEAQAIADEFDKLTEEEQGQLDTTKLEALFEYWNGQTDEELLPSSAFSYTVSDMQVYPDDGSLKSLKISIQSLYSGYAIAYGKIAILSAQTAYYENEPWFDAATARQGWPTLTKFQAKDPTVLAIGNGDEFRWTDGNRYTITVGFTKGQVPLKKTDTYYVYLITRQSSRGIYPDCLLTTLESKGNGSLEDNKGNEIKGDHTHTWKYEIDKPYQNTIKAYCTETVKSENCLYQKGNELTLVIGAQHPTYDGKPYDNLIVTNNISAVTGESVEIAYYNYDDDTRLASAPTDAGRYTVKVTIGGQTAIDNFYIYKAYISPSFSINDWTYGTKVDLPTVDGNAENGTVTYSYKKYGEDDSTYTEVTDLSTIPVGSYTLKASVAETKNYHGKSVTRNFEVTPQPITVTVSLDGWTYGQNANTPSITKDSNPGNGTVTYTYYTNASCTSKTSATDGAASVGAVPKNAGTYYVKAEVAAAGQYAKGRATAKFIIAPKSIQGATVTLTPGDVYHTGAEFTQAVDSVKLEGAALTASDYEVADGSTTKATAFGTYTITVKGVGNYKDSVSKEWNIRDNTLPTGEIIISENKWTSFWNGTVFGHFFKETQNVMIKASDAGSGVDKVYYYNSSEILQKDAVQAFSDDKWTEIANGGSYNIDPENQYVVYAKITDKSGNVEYISSEGFVIDKTAPRITGVDQNAVYCEAVTFTATDAYLDVVTVDGTAVTLNASGSYKLTADDKAHTIVAKDKAGNSTTVQVTVYNGHKWKAPVFTWAADYSSATAYFVCENNANHTEKKDCTVKREVTQPATGTARGVVTYRATVMLDGKKYEDTKTQESVIAASGEVGSNGGRITIEIIVSSDMPRTEVKNLTVEAAKALLTADELARVEAGEEVTIYLEVKSLTVDSVSAEDKNYVKTGLAELIRKLMQSEGLVSEEQVATGVQYMDISLYKKVGSDSAVKLTSTGQNELEVTIEIPDSLKSDNSKRAFGVIRVHRTNSAVSVGVLSTTRTDNNVMFRTDSFSTYAIAYAEPNGKSAPGNTGSNNGASNSGSTSSEASSTESTVQLPTAAAIAAGNNGAVADSALNAPAAAPDSQAGTSNAAAPQTGDQLHMTLWLVLLLASAAGLIVLLGKRKKNA